MNKRDQLYYHLKEADRLSKEMGLGDIWSYGKTREIIMSFELGHNPSGCYSGEDAFNENGEGVEYKSTITKNIKATYNGISVQPTWETQMEYMLKDKIGKYPKHYFARFDGLDILEIWEMTSNQVLECISPKIEKQYKLSKNRKDPRLGATISSKEIMKYGNKLK